MRSWIKTVNNQNSWREIIDTKTVYNQLNDTVHPLTPSLLQISLAKSTNVEGPYDKIATLLLPEAHNTQACCCLEAR